MGAPWRAAAWCAALKACCFAAAACTPLGDLERHASGAGEAPEASADTPRADVGEPRQPSSADAAAPPGDTPPPEIADAAPAPSREPPASLDGGISDTSSPVVSGTVPANGATGVVRDITLSIAFSERMNMASVEAGFVSETLPVSSLTFRWDGAGTLLNVALGEPLAYAEGADPTQVAPLVYDFGLSALAQDLAGNPLQESRVTFSTLRQIRITPNALAEPALTGNWRSDGIYGTDGCAELGNSMCVGDSVFGPNASYRGFVSFDVSALVPPAAEIVRAELEIEVEGLLGDPFGSLGELQLEHVSFDAIGPGAFGVSALETLGSVGAAAAGGLLRLDVLTALRADVEAGALSQYRFRFRTPSDGDGATDLLLLRRSSARLSVSYLVP